MMPVFIQMLDKKNVSQENAMSRKTSCHSANSGLEMLFRVWDRGLDRLSYR